MDGAQSNVKLEACPGCNRKFNPDSLAKHAKMCGKTGVPTRQFLGADGQQTSYPPMAGGSGGMDDKNVDGAMPSQPVSLTKCDFCNRRFNDEAFAKHQKTCGPKSGV